MKDFHVNKTLISFIVIIILFSIFHFLPYFLENKLETTIKEIEIKEGKPISEILEEQLAESERIKVLIEEKDIRDIIEKQEGKKLENIAIQRLKEIVEDFK
jgi:exopolysaccharide biosynthesis protein